MIADMVLLLVGGREMKKLPMWLGIVGVILFYLFLLWYSPGQPCLEWDGRLYRERSQHGVNLAVHQGWEENVRVLNLHPPLPTQLSDQPLCQPTGLRTTLFPSTHR